MDNDGKARAQLSVLQDGATALRLIDSEGTVRAVLALLGDGAPYLRFFDKGGRGRAMLCICPGGVPGLYLHDKGGRVRAWLAVDSDGSRALLHAAIEAQAAIYGGAEAGEVSEGLEASLFAINRDSGDRPVVTAADVVLRLSDVWEGFVAPEGAVSTGFADLDAVLGGFRAGQLVVICGSTGMGKTTVALNFARRAVLEGRTPLLFSLEMSRDEVTNNVLAAEAGVATTRLHDPRRLTTSDREALRAARGRIDLRRLRIQDAPDVTPTRIRSIARRERRLHGIDLALVDYVQLVQPNGGRRGRESREEEVASVSRALKALAREAGIPVVALAQLNRGPDTRDNHRPRLSDLRESSAIAHDADLVLAVYRESYYRPTETGLRNCLDVVVLKQRNGPTGTVRLAYRAEIARVDDMGASLGGEGRL